MFGKLLGNIAKDHVSKSIGMITDSGEITVEEIQKVAASSLGSRVVSSMSDEELVSWYKNHISSSDY